MSTQEDRLLAGKAIFAKVVAADVRAVVVATQEALVERIDVDGAIAAELPDGTRIGKVGRSKPATSATVTDDRALLEWVKQNRPDELVESVNPAFVAFLKDSAKKHGLAILPTGEVVPGVEQTVGTSSYLPREDKDMVPLIRQKFAELIGHGLLELPGPDVA